MSSLIIRRRQSSKINGAKSQGAITPEGKKISSLNALRHGLCADCILLPDESRENFMTLIRRHLDRFQPADEVEFNMIEEMASSYWRQRRAWTIETNLMKTQIALKPDDGTTGAFDVLSRSPALALVYRYEARQSNMYQRAIRTFAMPRRNVPVQNEPSPISEHPPEPPQPVETEPLVGQPILAAAGFQPVPRTPEETAPTLPHTKPSPLAPNPATPTPQNNSEGAP